MHSSTTTSQYDLNDKNYHLFASYNKIILVYINYNFVSGIQARSVALDYITYKHFPIGWIHFFILDDWSIHASICQGFNSAN